MYRKGQGVPQDYVEAYKWVSLAASQGYVKAIKGRHAVVSEMSPDQIAEAKRVAREWVEQHRD